MSREIKKTYWKSPITTESLTWNTATRVVFCEIMLHVRNTDTDQLPDEEKVGYWHGNKYLPYEYVKLNRGQCVFSVDRFARDLGVNPRKIKMQIEKLIEMQIIKQIERKSFGFVVTMNNYDELIKMQIETQNEKLIEMSEKSKGSNKSDYKTENKNDNKIFNSEKINSSFKGNRTLEDNPNHGEKNERDTRSKIYSERLLQ